MVSELNPCPWCGSANIEVNIGQDDSKYYGRAKCADCGTASPDGSGWVATQDQAEADARADWNDRPAPAPVAVPEGWKPVPVEPTEAMMKAGFKEEDADMDCVAIYRAMLAAAPSAPASQTEAQSAGPVAQEGAVEDLTSDRRIYALKRYLQSCADQVGDNVHGHIETIDRLATLRTQLADREAECERSARAHIPKNHRIFVLENQLAERDEQLAEMSAFAAGNVEAVNRLKTELESYCGIAVKLAASEARVVELEEEVTALEDLNADAYSKVNKFRVWIRTNGHYPGCKANAGHGQPCTCPVAEFLGEQLMAALSQPGKGE